MTEFSRQYSRETMDEIIRSLRETTKETRDLINRVHEETLRAINDLDKKVNDKNELMEKRVRNIEGKENFNSGFKKAISIIIGLLSTTVIVGVIYIFSTLQEIQITLASFKIK